MRFAAVLAISWLGLACGGGGGNDDRDAGADAGVRPDGGRDAELGPIADAGPWDGAIAEPAIAQEPRIPWLAAGAPDVAPPAAVAPPVLTCPSGWREVPPDPAVPGSPAVCDAWPAAGRAACDATAGLAHFPGEPGCARIGTACAADGWPTDLPAGRPVLHVRAGAAAGGDGSRAAPFARIADAIAAARGGPPGAVIALAVGRHAEEVTVPAGVAIWGACASDTVVVGSYDDIAATLRPAGPGVEIRNVRVAGDRPGIRVGPGASAHVEDVIVDAVLGNGIWVSGGDLTARSILVRETRPRRSDARGGYGLDVSAGTADVTRAIFDRSTQRAVGSNAVLTLRDAALLDTRPLADDAWGHGLSIQGGTALAERLTIERNQDFGVWVVDGGALTLRDAVVRDTEPRGTDDQLGQGASVGAGGSMTLERVLLQSNHTAGAEAVEAGTRMTLRDVVVRDTQPQRSSNELGYGLSCDRGATVDAARLAIERNHHGGVTSGACTLDLSDLAVRDTQPRAGDGAGGEGVALTAGARATIRRVLSERNRRNAIYALGAGTTLLLEDATLRETGWEESTRRAGRGLLVNGGAGVEARRAHVDGAYSAGFHVDDVGSRLVLEDARVERVMRAPESTQGEAIYVEGGRAEVDRFVARELAGFGAVARIGAGVEPCSEPHLVLRDASIERVAHYHAIASFGGCLALERFVGRGAYGYGLSNLGARSQMWITDALVEDTESFVDTVVPGQEGAGLQIGGGIVEASRVMFVNNRLAGVVVGAYERDGETYPSTATISDLIVRDTRAQVSPAEGGYGIQVGGPSTLDLTRGLLERNRSAGVWVTDTSRFVGRDLIVRDMRSTEIVGVHGQGINAIQMGSAEITRVLIERARSTAVLAIDPGANIQLHDAIVRETLEAECGADACEGTAYGVGVGAYYGGRITMARFRVEESAICGVQVAAGGAIDLAHGEVAANPIGANVQDPGYDLRRLMQDVAYRGNRVNLDASSLPVPGR